MIPVEQMELLRSEAPAASALAQLDRYGFALVTGAGRLRYVEVDDLLQRILLKAVVAQAVRGGTRPSDNPQSTADPRQPRRTSDDQ